MKKTLLAIIIALLMAVPAFAVGPPGSGSGSGVQTAADCDVAAYYAIGTLCQDTDDGKLYKGTGAAIVEIAAGSSGDFLADGSVPMTAILPADLGLRVKNGTDSPGFVDLYEDGSNGSSYFRLYGPDALAGNIFMKLPETAGATGGSLYFSAANTLAVAAAGTENQVWAMGATVPAWTSTLGSTGTRLTKGWFTDLEVTNAIAGAITGNAGTATALAADPDDCAAGQLATGIAASGALTCSATPTLTSLSLGADPADAGALRLSSGDAIVWENDTTEVSLTHVANSGLLLNAAYQLQFRDATSYIWSSGAGSIGIASTNQLDINTALIATMAGITMDDGTGDSPALTLKDGTDETAAFVKKDAGYVELTTVAGDGLNVLVGNLKVGNGSPNQDSGPDGEDAYIEGKLEVDGRIYADGGITTAASAAGGAGIRLPHGSAPDSPVNGDCWTTTGGLYCRINGATVGPYAIAGEGSGDFLADGTVPMTGELDAAAGLKVGNGATSSGLLKLLEDSTNGTDYAYVRAGEDVATGRSIRFGISTADTENFAITFGANDNTLLFTSETGVNVLNLTGWTVNATAFSAAASASPTILLNDSDALGADKEIGKIVGAYIDGADGAENGTVSIYAHEAGTTTEYIQVDGKNVTIDLLKPVVTTSTVQVGTNIELGHASDTTIARDSAGVVSIETVPIVTRTSTDTLTNKTFDVDGTNNVLKQWGYIVLTHPHLCAAGAPMQTTSTANTFGQCKFGNATDKATNYAEYYLVVPPDIDTSVDLTGTFKLKLGGADTGDHEYEISFDSVADSAAYAGSLGDAISLAFTADASGADADVETAGPTTLTGWKDAMTASQLFVVRLARDGDHANDGSSVDSYSGPLVIKYKKTQ